MKRKIVLKIGGSTLYENDRDVNFSLLEKLKAWYDNAKYEYSKIVIVTGGGVLSRDLHQKIKENIDNQDTLHNVAMSVTQTSAELVAGYLEDENIYTPKKLGDAYEYLLSDASGALVSGGLRPGWSTDMDAAVFADIISSNRVYKISNIDYIYTKDPRKYQDAEIIKDMTWQDYFNLFQIKEDDEHEVNANIPIDKSCARFSRTKNISFFICGGVNIENSVDLEEILAEGTLIHP